MSDLHFSTDNSKKTQQLLEIIKDCINKLNQTQKVFIRIIPQQLFWVLQEWLDLLKNQNFTHNTKEEIQNCSLVLNELKGGFETISFYISKIKVGINDSYTSQIESYEKIFLNLQNLKNVIQDHIQKIIKSSLNPKDIEYLQHALTIENSKSDLGNYDMMFNEAMKKNPKKNNLKLKSDIAVIIVPLEIDAIELSDFFACLKQYCKSKGIELQQDIHQSKLQYALGETKEGKITPQEINDFFIFIWCNQLERTKLLDSTHFGTTKTKKNKNKLVLQLIKKSDKNKMENNQVIEINEKGLIDKKGGEGSKNDTETKSQSVRFGRESHNSIIKCDLEFGKLEKAISKRQFVIKPDLDCYYAYCISTTNPTEFLVQKEGAYLTHNSEIILSDKISLNVEVCIVKGEVIHSKINNNMEIEDDQETEDGATVKRGNRVNPTIQKLQQQLKNNKNITQIPKPQQSKPIEIMEDEDEITNNINQNKTFERRKGGFPLLQELLGMKIEKEQEKEAEEEEEEEKMEESQVEENDYKTATYKGSKIKYREVSNEENIQVSKEYDIHNFPNEEMYAVDKDERDPTRYFIKLNLNWSDIEQSNISFSKENQYECSKSQIWIGSSEDCDIKIKSPIIKPKHALISYNEEFAYWKISDPYFDFKDVNEGKFSTISFKPCNSPTYSASYKLKKDTIIIVQGNFFKVNFQPQIQNQH